MRTPPASFARLASLLSWCIAATVVATVHPATPVGAQAGDEVAPRFSAAELLAPDIVKGPHHQVDAAVRTDGYFHEFTVVSTFGTFTAVGRSELAVRIREITALAALDEVSRTEVFLASAGQSVVKIGQGAAAAVTDPVSTVKGVGAGVKRFGVNLGRRTQRAVESAGDGATEEGGNAAAGAASSVLGVSGAMRQWARKVGADPYTTNPVLRKALEDVARVDAAGSIVTKVAVPIPAPVGTLSSVGDLVWGQDPEAVRKANEGSLRGLGVPADVAARLFGNRWFTLTAQTRLVAALVTVRAPGVADYVQTAADARNAREALFFVESAEMLQQHHGRQPVVQILSDSRAVVVVGADRHVRALLPLDWIASTDVTRAAIGDITTRARQELRGSRFELDVTGRVSDRVRGELEKLGWVVTSRETAR